MGMIRRALAGFGFYRPVPGDVVLDRFDGVEKTVECVVGNRVRVAFFNATGLHRATVLLRSVIFVR